MTSEISSHFTVPVFGILTLAGVCQLTGAVGAGSQYLIGIRAAAGSNRDRTVEGGCLLNVAVPHSRPSAKGEEPGIQIQSSAYFGLSASRDV